MGIIAKFNVKKKRKTIHLKSILKTEVTNGTASLEINPKSEVRESTAVVSRARKWTCRKKESNGSN